MTPLDILIVVLVVFNVIIGILMIVAMVMFIGLLREAREVVRDVSRAYRFVRNLEFLPPMVAGFIFDRFFGKK
jgi:hypothetical protein